MRQENKSIPLDELLGIVVSLFFMTSLPVVRLCVFLIRCV